MNQLKFKIDQNGKKPANYSLAFFHLSNPETKSGRYTTSEYSNIPPPRYLPSATAPELKRTRTKEFSSGYLLLNLIQVISNHLKNREHGYTIFGNIKILNSTQLSYYFVNVVNIPFSQLSLAYRLSLKSLALFSF